MREIRQGERRRVVSMDVVDAGNRFADASRDTPDADHAFLGQEIYSLLQFRDDVGLQRNDRNARQTHNRVLDEDKDEDGQHGAALKKRQFDGVREELAERLDLGGDHRSDFALRSLLKLLEGETVDAFEELITQAAQEALRGNALKDEQRHHDAAVHDQEDEKETAQRQQVFLLIEFDSEVGARKRDGIGFRAQGIVDDNLR